MIDPEFFSEYGAVVEVETVDFPGLFNIGDTIAGLKNTWTYTISYTPVGGDKEIKDTGAVGTQSEEWSIYIYEFFYNQECVVDSRGFFFDPDIVYIHFKGIPN